MPRKGYWVALADVSDPEATKLYVAENAKASSQKSRSSKDFLLLCSLKPYSLFRFLAGDHYGKGKSLRDGR